MFHCRLLGMQLSKKLVITFEPDLRKYISWLVHKQRFHLHLGLCCTSAETLVPWLSTGPLMKRISPLGFMSHKIILIHDGDDGDFKKIKHYMYYEVSVSCARLWLMFAFRFRFVRRKIFFFVPTGNIFESQICCIKSGKKMIIVFFQRLAVFL